MAHNHEDMNESQELPSPRILPHVVAHHALHNPEKIWGSLPKDASHASKGYEDITFARLSYAVDRTARWMETTLGKGNFESLAYLGPPDSRYVIFVLGSIKARFQMLFLSPRNSDEAQYHIMKQAKCRRFLCAEPMRKRVDALIRDWPSDSSGKINGEQDSSASQVLDGDVKVYTVPDQYDLLENTPVPVIPFEKSVDEVRQDPLVILHTSSTTGLPKIIPLNQGYGFHEDILQHFPQHKSLDLITRKPFYGKCRMFVAMPLFHGGGILLTLLKSLYHDLVAVFQPPSVPLSATVFDAIMRYGQCNGCVIPPSLLEEMIAEPSYFDTLANLDFVQFGSGPLSKVSGDTLLTRQTNCPHFMGSTEVGILPLLELDDPVRDWQYFYFHPWSGVEMRPVSDDAKMSEMVITRVEKRAPGLQPVFELFPDIKEWKTQDLYVRHPTKPHLWRSSGRNDDVMVLSNGEKLNPIDMEGAIANTIPAIVGALVIGQGRFMPGLLLETKGVDVSDPAERAKLVEEIWPSVEKANLEAPKHAQLTKSLILFTSPDKPFARTPKLSVRRGPTIQLYADEIAEMYEKADMDLEASIDVDLPDNVDLGSYEAVGELVTHLVQGLTGWKTLPGPEDDLFMLGFDSLLVLRMTRAIKLILSRHSSADKPKEMTSRTVYNSPTINDLTRSIYSLANGRDQNNGETFRESKIDTMIAKYSEFNFSQATSQATTNGTDASPRRWVVVLTGSTGSFGTYLLWFLLRNPIVSTIYCLNRSLTARNRQLEALDAQGLSIDSLGIDERVKFLHSESLAAPNLGLEDEETYRDLVQSCPTHIVHNAWPVNFNLNLTSFESHIAGVRALIDLCVKVGPKKPHFFFVSSISSGTAMSVRSPVPEKMVFDASAPSEMGYGESKYVSEHVLNAATAASGGALQSTILRVGQIAGPVGWRYSPAGGSESAAGSVVKGIWPTREWLPSLIMSSQSVGALPKTLGKMDSVAWIPVDMLATIVCEIMDTEKVASSRSSQEKITNGSTDNEASVYNLLNPNVISWQADLLPTVQQQLQIKEMLSLSEWVNRVRDGPDEADEASPNPSRKILEFYEALDVQSGSIEEDIGESERYKTGRAGESSKIFRELGPIKKEWMASWIRQWGLVK